jgi:hypothetical protein
MPNEEDALETSTVESRCANCGKPASVATACISEYPEEGEWFCSEQCKDQHDELDCPHITHDGYRHPAESQRLIECEAALRSLAYWLGAGGYNATAVDAKVFEEKIRWGVEHLLGVKAIPLTPESTSPAEAWPKERDIGRYGDMSPHAHIRVGFDSDNDVYVSVWDENGGASIEFCQPGAGGGKSSRTRMALIALMVAMEADNADTPTLDWWARRSAAVKEPIKV